jgi:hypothetical protein
MQQAMQTLALKIATTYPHGKIKFVRVGAHSEKNKAASMIGE